MRNREDRHRKIRFLVASNRIESQEDLREKLRTEGYDVTQATLSRDLRYLKVGKITDEFGSYHYGIQEGVEDYVHDLMRGWISIAFSGSVGVVKTLPGHANSVAVAIDELEFDELLGTVAGDDTIMLVLRDKIDPRTFLESLAKAVPGLGDSGDPYKET